MIAELIAQGITPIIAHPERLECLCSQPQRLAQWVMMGALAQVTADSMLGRMGKNARKMAESLIKQRLAHLLATDAHHATHRRAQLANAFALLREWLPKEEAALFRHNANAILAGESCRVMEPARPAAKKWWFW